MPGPLRVLIVVPTVDPVGQLSAGGAERIARNLCLAFDRQRITPLLATYEAQGSVGEELTQADIKTFVVTKTGKLSLSLIKELRQIIKSEAIDAVLSMHHGVNLYNLLATMGLKRVARLIRLGRIGVSFSIQVTEGLLSSQADLLICNSEAAADAVRGIYTIPPSRYKTIPNGCDIQRFKYVPYEQRFELREALELPRDAFILYTPNRIHENKGQDNLVAALARIPQLLKQHNVLWVNTGLIQSEETARRILSYAAGIKQHIQLLPPTPTPEQWIAACDAVVIPSRTESFPNVILEASAIGRPLLTTTCGAAATVGLEIGAILAAADSVRDLEQGLIELIESTAAYRAGKGEYANEIVRERYTIQAVASQYAEAIEAAVANRRG